MLSPEASLSDEVSDSEYFEAPEGERKGVLFILDSFKKTRRYQNLLKSKEVISLYSKIKNQQISRANTVVSNTTAKSKGVLVNKKHY